MATPIIQSTGSTSGAGTAGRGRNNLVLSETVTLSDTEAANIGAIYAWLMEDRPIGSSTTLVAPTTSTPTFIPDVTGSYRIRCTVNGVDVAIEVLAVPLAVTGGRIPSFQEQLEYDGGSPVNTSGWHEALTVFMRNVDSSIGSSGSTLNSSYNFGGAGAGRVISVNAAQPVELRRSSIGAVSANIDGLALANITAAALGAQQWSPSVSIRGNGWSTGASASRVVDLALQTQTVQGSEPTGSLAVLASINGAAYTKLSEFDWDGATSQARVMAGTAARPSWSYLTDTATGHYLVGAGQLGVSVAGVNAATWSNTGLAVVGRVEVGGIYLIAGAADPTAGAGVVAPVGSKYYRTNGTEYLKTAAGDTAWTRVVTATFDAAVVISAGNLTLSAGNVLASRFLAGVDSGASPGYSWQADGSNDGLFKESANQIGFAADGVRYFRVGATTGAEAINGRLGAGQQVLLTGIISPTQIVLASTVDWAPASLSTASIVRVDANQDFTIHGLTGPSGGRLLTLLNISAFNMTLPHDSGTNPTAANRFLLPAGLSSIIPTNGAAFLMYDSTSTRWRLMGVVI